ncbi:unnamed protein product [Clonostachys rhizophaga]|uniref:FAD-binding domain-containing protein n=1 Tax=Clonostachys rhizophaga TaxID=160324 RepID=A0A9N9VZU6_9HYPO|nr:unnamed protein product [Clonostachys rhizophaga]
MKLKIIIAGGGLSGLGAAIALRQKGHDVTVLESASRLAEVGAGIQIPPNSTRVLKEYGIYDEILKYVVWPKSIQIRRYATGEILDRTHLHPRLSQVYGFPYLLIHRADYQRILCQYAEKLGAKVLLNSPVDSVDEAGPSVKLANGDVLTGDLIVGADGIKSRTRASILGNENPEPVDSPDCAYRAVISREAMLKDPETAVLMDDVNCNCWIGEQGHIMAYPIDNGQAYNVVMPHPGKATLGKWNEPGDLNEMRQNYQTYDPVIRKVLEKVESVLKWKLAEMPPLPRWLSNNGRVVLIGDAAHATVPYLAQGAAMSIEDGAALAECLDLADNMDMVPFVLKAFEEVRKPRCETIQSVSRGNGDVWHLPDGPAQVERDSKMGKGLRDEEEAEAEEKLDSNSNRWSDGSFQPWLFGYDTVSETRTFVKKRLSPSL